MRVRPSHPTADRRSSRWPHVIREATTDARARAFSDERRWREAGGPEDRATYSCACGMQFEAPVSTSVACPNCGSGQAW